MGKRHFRFFEISPGTYKTALFGEMDPITPAQCVQAVESSQTHSTEIELYLCEPQPNGTWGPDGTPLTGFCFKDGVYYGHGLGHETTEELEKEAFTVTDWHAFFSKAAPIS